MKTMHKMIVSLLLTTGLSTAGELAVIVPASSSVQTLDKGGVAKFFLKKVKKWDDGAKVKSVDAKGVARDAFLKKVLGLTSDDLDRYWIELQYQSGQSPADAADGDASGVAKVASTPGSIAAVDAAAAKANSGVRIVFTLAY